MKIVLDAGHGPNTPGKRTPDGSMREYHFNAAVARYATELLAGYEGVETLFVHEDVRDVPLAERTNKANAWGADVYVSIHANAAGDGGWSAARGIETFVSESESRPPAAVALASAVQRRLIKQTGLPDRGVKSANFHVLRATRMTAILVECGFMTSRADAELLKTDVYRRLCAAAIVAGIVEAYGIKKREENEPMTAAEKKEFEAMVKRIEVLEERLKQKEAPAWAQPTVNKLTKKASSIGSGVVLTDPTGDHSFFRTLVVLDRTGAFD